MRCCCLEVASLCASGQDCLVSHLLCIDYLRISQSIVWFTSVSFFIKNSVTVPIYSILFSVIFMEINPRRPRRFRLLEYPRRALMVSTSTCCLNDSIYCFIGVSCRRISYYDIHNSFFFDFNIKLLQPAILFQHLFNLIFYPISLCDHVIWKSFE